MIHHFVDIIGFVKDENNYTFVCPKVDDVGVIS